MLKVQLMLSFFRGDMDVQKDIVEAVRQTVLDYAMFEAGDTILLSMSAGKDSMAMLDILFRLSPEFGISLGIYHLNHLTRGAESDADEEFVRAAAERYGLSLTAERHDFSGISGSFEERAREYRYARLKALCREKGYSKAATAHNLNDNAETVLMRLFRGTGLHGLAGVPYTRNDIIIRPLRRLSVSDILQYLKAENIRWREDASNGDISYTRNHIRHSVMNQALERFPSALNAIEKLGGISRDYLSLIDRLISGKYGELVRTDCKNGDVVVDISNLCGDRALFCHVAASALRESLGEYVSYNLLEDIWGKSVSSSSHVRIIDKPGLSIIKTIEEGITVLKISRVGTYYSEHVSYLYSMPLKELPFDVNVQEYGYRLRFQLKEDAAVDLCRVKEGGDRRIFVTIRPGDTYINVRSRKNGDRIKAGGHTKKIKDIFINSKLNPIEKNKIPIIDIDGETVAIIGFYDEYLESTVSNDRYAEVGKEKILEISRL